MSTERLFVGQSFTPQLRGVNLVPPATPKIVSWSEGTDAEIAALLDAHYAGTINIQDYWNVGDTRTIHLSAMNAIGVSESHREQDVDFQIVNVGGKTLADGVTECAFIVHLKDALTDINGDIESGNMHSSGSNIGGWRDCARRVWCNSIFKEALPEGIRSIFKLHLNDSGRGNSDPYVYTTEDYFAIPCEYNIFGGASRRSYSWNEDYPSYWSYYDSDERRIKYFRGTNNPVSVWWLRSVPSGKSAYYRMDNTGKINTATGLATTNAGIFPFGVI